MTWVCTWILIITPHTHTPYRSVTIYTLESSFHYKRVFLPLIWFVGGGGGIAPIFMVTWFTPRGMPLPNLEGLQQHKYFLRYRGNVVNLYGGDGDGGTGTNPIYPRLSSEGYNYSLWGPNFHCFYSTTHGFRDIHTLHIFPISNQSSDFWSMKDWCNEHCIWQAWPSGIYLCSCKISKQNIR